MAIKLSWLMRGLNKMSPPYRIKKINQDTFFFKLA